MVMRLPKAIAFDCFGTVFDMSNVPKEELMAYGYHIRAPQWSPLELPESWKNLKAFPDSAEGIKLLRQKFTVITCANGPMPLLSEISENNGIDWDCIVPMETMQVFKPSPQAYLWACAAVGLPPADVMMVTANVPGLGDLTVANSLGMIPQQIRGGDGPATIIELAHKLLALEAEYGTKGRSYS